MSRRNPYRNKSTKRKPSNIAPSKTCKESQPPTKKKRQAPVKQKLKRPPLTAFFPSSSKKEEKNAREDKEENAYLFPDPFADLRASSGKGKTSKTNYTPLPPIPIQGLPSSVDGLIGNYAGKKKILEFLDSPFSVLIVWGQPGVGKSSLVHMLLQNRDIWVHTLTNLYDYVRVEGNAPKLSASMQRILSRRMPGKRKEIFFLDHIESECINNPEEIKRIIQLIFSDQFQKSKKKLIVCLDNLYARECTPFRKFLTPTRINNRKKITLGTTARFWKLKESDIKIVLQHHGIFSGPVLQRGIDVANGDARQAILYSEMQKRLQGTKAKVTALRDIVSNPFDSCHAAFRGDKERAKTGGNWFILRALVHYNYPTNLMPEKSVWDSDIKIRPVTQNKIYAATDFLLAEKPVPEKYRLDEKEAKDVATVYQRDALALDTMSSLASDMSHMGRVGHEHANELMLSSLASNKARWQRNQLTCKWPMDMFYEKHILDNHALSVNMRQLLSIQATDLGLASRIINSKVDAEIKSAETPTLNWLFTHDISRTFLVEQATLFQ